MNSAQQAVNERIAEYTRNSPEGMRATAIELRKKARTMRGSADSDAMVRIAAACEARADDIEQRRRRRI